MSERWVSPPLVPREPAPRWIGVWRFRIGALIVLALLVLAVVLLIRQLTGANAQDPGIGAPAPASAVLLDAPADPR